jgi:hypothetical protein
MKKLRCISSGERTRPRVHFSAPRRKENKSNTMKTASRGREAEHARRPFGCRSGQAVRSPIG